MNKNVLILIIIVLLVALYIVNKQKRDWQNYQQPAPPKGWLKLPDWLGGGYLFGMEG